jgi:hypothetical protein
MVKLQAPYAAPISGRDGVLTTPWLRTFNLLFGAVNSATAFGPALTSNTTYYVSPSGSDANTGGTPTAAFKTVQQAVNSVTSLDLNGFAVTLQLADGTYAENVIIPVVDDGVLIITGNVGAPANVVVQSVTAAYGTVVASITNLSLTNGSPATRIFASGGGVSISFSNVVFGAVTSAHISADTGAHVAATGAYSIVGGGNAHIKSIRGASVEVVGETVTLTGVPAFAVAFVFAQYCGTIIATGNTFGGSATGPRYSASLNGVIYTAGATLPGSIAGSTATGGQYG